MNINLIYIGLDVDDTQYRGSALYTDTGEVTNFKFRPTMMGLLGRLVKLYKAFPMAAFTLSYEAFYVGDSLVDSR